MKRAITALVLLPLLSIPVWSSSQVPNSFNCVESGGVPVDTVTNEVVLPSGGNSVVAIWEVIVSRTSSGSMVYTIDASSIYFTGDGTSINGMSTLQIFDILARATVAQGIAQGYTTCPTTCNPPAYVTVRQPACVTRTGSALTTHFTPCVNPGCCIRDYSVCCPSGQSMPVVTLVSSTSPDCQSGGPNCETTCP